MTIDRRCTRVAQRLGVAYPRTCMVCRLGPCSQAAELDKVRFEKQPDGTVKMIEPSLTEQFFEHAAHFPTMTAAELAQGMAILEGSGQAGMSNRGLTKLVEECGELVQIAAKKIAYPDTDEHPDGKGPMKARMIEEMGDVKAASQFVAYKLHLPQDLIDARAAEKLALFMKWDAEQ